MHKNTTVSDLNVEIHGKGNIIKRHLVAKIGIGIVEFFLASVLYCYGIFLSEYVFSRSHDYPEGIWTSILFICSWSFTDPVARFISEYFEDRKILYFRCIIGINVEVLFLAAMVSDSIVLYMIFGGIISNLISVQITAYALDKLDIDSKIVEAIRQVARALSLFIMPHCIFLLLSNPNYDIGQVKLIFGAILFNIVPAALLIKTEDVPKEKETVKDIEMSRYQTIGKEEEDNQSDSSSISSDNEEPVLEMNSKYFPVSTTPMPPSEENNDNFTMPSYSIGGSSSQNTFHGIDNFGSSEHTVNELPIPNVHLSPMSVQSYFLNVGVNILPGIPEENEDEESDDINWINPKRLSRISGKLEELNIQDQIRRNSIKEELFNNIKEDAIEEVFNINEVTKEHKPEPINKIEYIPNFKGETSRISVLDELKNMQKTRHCFHCSPYKKYIWTRRLRMFKDFTSDNIIRPLYHAMKNLYFYPSLTTKIVTNLVSTLYITLAPFMALQHSWKQHMLFSTENVTFLLTYVAFAWCFFLVCLPLVLKLSHSKVRIVFAFGLVVTGTSLWVLSVKVTNEVITISSLLFGFGYGIVSYTEKIVFKTSIGMRPWYLVRGPLEIISALSILLIYFLIYLYKLELNCLLFLAALSYYFNALLWFCLPFVKYFTSIVKRIVFDERSQQEGFFH